MTLKLVAGGSRFRQVGRLGGDRAHVRFDGQLDGVAVTWDARVYTLAGWYRRHGGDGSMQLRQFIDVGANEGGMRTVDIGLDVPRIDRQVIEKTMIMLRGYRRLREGRHEFGPIRSFPAPPAAT